MAFNLSSPNYLDPRSGMPGNRPMGFLSGGAMGGNSQGFLGATNAPSTSLTTTPKLDLLKVEKSPELNQTLRNLTSDLDKLRTEQNTAADTFAKMNAELFGPNYLGQQLAKFDLAPVRSLVNEHDTNFGNAIRAGLREASNQATRDVQLRGLGETALGGGIGQSSQSQILANNLYNAAYTPFLGAIEDRRFKNALMLDQLQRDQVGKDLALRQAYLNQQAMPAQLRAQLAAQQAGLLGNYSNLFNNLNFLGVGGQNPMSNPFIGASPNVPYYPAPSPARRGTGSFDNTPTDIPLGGRRPPAGVTTNAPVNPLQWTAAQRAAYLGRPNELLTNPNYDPETSPAYGAWVGGQWLPYDSSGNPDWEYYRGLTPVQGPWPQIPPTTSESGWTNQWNTAAANEATGPVYGDTDYFE